MKTPAAALLPPIAVERNLPQPLHRQVYDAYRKAIEEGSLRGGQKVPSTRTLAVELGVSRIPLLRAYSRLSAEGYFYSRVGAGTVVCTRPPEKRKSSNTNVRARRDGATVPLWTRYPATTTAIEDLTAWRSTGAFSVGQIAFEHFPLRTWNALVTRHSRRISARSLDYGNSLGSRYLREALAVYLRTARAVKCEPDQIMLVSGSQQALDISVRALLNAGDRVWVEDPGYPFARGVLELNGCDVIPVPVDDEGLDVAAGLRQSPAARAAIVSPSHQFPLGVTMSNARRRQLLDWAARSRAWIIEDDYDSEYRYEGKPVPSLQGADKSSRVIFVGTFSKLLFPSLRLGFVVIPADLVDRFISVRAVMDIAPPSPLQGVVADFIGEGHFSRHIRRMRALYAERRAKLVQTLSAGLPLASEISPGAAGMYLTVTLADIRDREIAARANQQRLSLVPLSPTYVADTRRQGFILGFGGVPVSDIPQAVRKLRGLVGHS